MTDSDPTLIGIILDVSSSMRNNWRNSAGGRASRLDVIKDVLNEQFWKLAVLQNTTCEEISFFCLGMGLQKTITYVGVDLKGKEKTLLDQEPLIFKDSGLVCDLLALSQIIPTKSTLEKIKETLDRKWRSYAGHILRVINGQISPNAQQGLRDFVQHGIEESARNALHHSWRYILLKWLEHTSLQKRWSTLNHIVTDLNEHTINWEAKIQHECSSESDKYAEAIQIQIEQFFESKKMEYLNLIDNMLREFATAQIQIILELLTAGYSIQRAMDNFDDDMAFLIASKIYQHLDDDVKRHLQIPILRDLEKFTHKIRFELHASVDRRVLQSLTREYIQQYAWATLEPFVEKTIFSVVTERFGEVARKMMLYWVSISAKRELTQSLKDFKGILPEAISEEALRNEYLFGTTPIKEALSVASARLLDSKYEAYNKFLIIISDGEFDSDSSAQSLEASVDTLAELLKRSGVTIISLCVTRSKAITELISQISSRRSLGVRTMFAISSQIRENPRLTDWFLQENPDLSLDKRLFIQLNEAKLLQEVFGGILGFARLDRTF